MTTKEYLSQVYHLNNRIGLLLTQIQRSRARCLSISISYDKEGTNPSGATDAMASSIVRYVDDEEELKSIMQEYKHKKDQIIECINNMSKAKYSDVLYGKYIVGLSLEELSVQFGQTRRQMINILNSAHEDFEKRHGELYMNS